ncbi:MAG TPA: hypothetical protein VN767_01940, partial [Streptosporangiaceae bacterium]|nr:hypothetical protein [Streptosporangiaceae bacterium]
MGFELGVDLLDRRQEVAAAPGKSHRALPQRLVAGVGQFEVDAGGNDDGITGASFARVARDPHRRPALQHAEHLLPGPRVRR